MIVNQSAVNAPLPLDVDAVFVADSGDISARGGFMIARQLLQINSIQLAQRLEFCIAVRSSKGLLVVYSR